MKLIIMRHGEASFGADSDAQRTLTPYGCKQILSSAKQLDELDGWITDKTRIYHSPFLRTVQTAKIVSEHCNIAMTAEETLKAGTHFEKIIEWLQSIHDKDVIVISHNPMVSQLTHALVYGLQAPGTPMPLVFDTGYACCLQCEETAYGCTELIKCVVPFQVVE
jgi:phosphohistidine phosphatase SixA